MSSKQVLILILGAFVVVALVAIARQSSRPASQAPTSASAVPLAVLAQVHVNRSATRAVGGRVTRRSATGASPSSHRRRASVCGLEECCTDYRIPAASARRGEPPSRLTNAIAATFVASGQGLMDVRMPSHAAVPVGDRPAYLDYVQDAVRWYMETR
jgi:hypothetical protein